MKSSVNLKKKSQSAMEFLMSYGWVLLSVLVVISSLIYFGVLDPETYLPEKVDLKQGLDIIDASVDENSLSFILKNDFGRDIRDFQLNATGCNDGDGALSTPVDIPEGKVKKITVYCEHDYEIGNKIDSDLEATWKTRTSTKGTTYDFDHTTSGSMKITVSEGKELYDQAKTTICGTLNLSRTTYILQNNISTTGDCFVIAANYVTIDLNGYKISGDDGSGDYGVYSDGYNYTTIKNGIINDFDEGVYLRFNSYNNLTNISFNSNDDSGIYIVSSLNNTIRNITSNSNYYGIKMNTGTYNLFQDIITNSNTIAGIQFSTGQNNSLTRIVANSNGWNGISLMTNSDNNTIYNFSTWSSSTTTGTSFYSGIYVYQSKYNVFEDGYINKSNGHGVHLRARSTGNVSHNVFKNIKIENTNYYDIDFYTDFGGHGFNNTLINMTFNISDVNVDDYGFGGTMELTKKWYYRAYVNDSFGNPLVGATIKLTNSSGDSAQFLTTGSDGWTSQVLLTDYFQDDDGIYFYSNYTVNASYNSSGGYISNFNLTNATNKLDDAITLNYTLDPFVFFGINTPLNDSSQSEDSILVNLSANHSSKNISTIIDFDDSLVSWYTMDDVAGDQIIDRGSFRRNMTLKSYGGSASGKSHYDLGYFGNSFKFVETAGNSNGDYMITTGGDYNDYSNLSNENRTITVWLKPNSTQVGGLVMGTMYQSWHAESNGGWNIRMESASTCVFQWRNDVNTWKKLTYSSLVPNQWNHVVVLANDTYMAMYVNGVLRDDDNNFGGFSDYGNSLQHDNLMLGGGYPTSYLYGYNGHMDDVMLFNRTLSSEEILALYANTSSRQLSYNFTDLGSGSHTFKGYTESTNGDVSDTIESTVRIS